MKPAISIQIIWPLAAQEAIVAESEFIEPSHLFLGALKFAELEKRHIEQLVRNPKDTGLLLAERDSIRSKLRDCSIEVPEKSRPIRYGLRKRLGKGGHAYDGQRVIHRSPASREVFKRAEDAARSVESSKCHAAHLIQALLETSSPEMNDVLSEVGISPVGAAKDTPYLDKYGRDLSAEAVEKREHLGHDQESDIAKDPVCKVVMDDILRGEKTNILLIQKGERSPKQIVERIAQYYTGGSAPAPAKDKRVMEIDISKTRWNTENVTLDPRDMEDMIGSVFREASEAGNIILFLSDFHIYFETKPGANFSYLLKDQLSIEKVQCIIGTDEGNYQKHIAKDLEWRKLLSPVWIHDIKVPLQL